ncbi:MAG TPA: dihydrodipicolinate synthase family protein [Chryseolinea sp.]|nr:dihydrodipicolinate synthase family protein [Chryseolinea sp.]
MSQTLSRPVKKLLFSGTVIPAHPLALDHQRKLDEKYQRALTRYYLDAGAGGVAVGVHTTQFEIRHPAHRLYETVLKLAAEEITKANLQRPFIKVAGIVGPTDQAVAEAKTAIDLGYDMGLLSNGGLPSLTESQLISRLERVAEVIPVFGFYLQPAVGGRVLSFDFWKRFAANENVHAIKVAAFNRYQTLDVVRAVALSPRATNIALYTGNDDNIVGDLVTPYKFEHNGVQIEKAFVGGLLGHWAFWTKGAVQLLEQIKHLAPSAVRDMLSKGIEITDTNAAVFDAAHNFHGCISGINEILFRQGLLATNYCLNEEEQLSPGQSEEINRVYSAYGHLNDDDFVKGNLERWLS